MKKEQVKSKVEVLHLFRWFTHTHALHEMDVEPQKQKKNCDFTWPIATLSHEMDVERQKLK